MKEVIRIHQEDNVAVTLRDFLAQENLMVDGKEISPLQFTSKILFEEWKLGADEGELTVMKVILKGQFNGIPKTIEYNLLDRYDPITKTSSMSRTTGYTCTASANLIAKNLFTGKGVFPPELVGKHKPCFEFVVNYLKERTVNWNKKEY